MISTTTPLACDRPLFATVSFCCAVGGDASGSEEGVVATFRVPVGPDTTIKQLAKGAMQRLAVSRRGSVGLSSEMRVTAVFVGGGPQPKAEVFSHDLVVHVVLLREETVYMRLAGFENVMRPVTEVEIPLAYQLKPSLNHRPVSPTSSSSNSRTEEQGVVPHTRMPAPAPSTTSNSSSTRGTTEREKSSAPTKSASSVAPPKKTSSRSTLPREASGAVPVQRSGVKRPRDGAQAVVERKSQEQEEPSKGRLGWGPKAHESFASNYISSPEKLLRRLKAEKRAKERNASANNPVSAAETSYSEQTNTRAEASCAGVAGNPDAPPATRKAGWGPEAYKNFPDNYTDMPNRICRRKSNQTKKKGNVSPTVISDDDVARRLSYEDADDGEEEHRKTIGHVVLCGGVGEDSDATHERLVKRSGELGSAIVAERAIPTACDV